MAMHMQSPGARTSSILDNLHRDSSPPHLCKLHSCILAQVCSLSLGLSDKGFEAWLLEAIAESWGQRQHPPDHHSPPQPALFSAARPGLAEV